MSRIRNLALLCLVTLIVIQPLFSIHATDGNKAIGRFANDFVKQITKEYGLRVFATGASFPVKLESISLTFEANYSKDVSSARKLVVEIAHQMIEKMNQDSNLQKYLSNTPATVKNIELTIIFKEEDKGKYPGPLNCVMIIGVRNKVIFNTLDEKKNRFVNLHRETFEEAEKIVKQESSSKPSTKE